MCAALVDGNLVTKDELGPEAAADFRPRVDAPLTSRAFILRNAALCYELEGRLILRFRRDPADAGTAYSTAIFQYGRAGAFE
jgi:hypothetical protein